MATKEDWLAAKMRWESDPTVNESDVARELGVTRAAVNARKKREKWERVSDQGDLARRAHDRADREAAQRLVATERAKAVLADGEAAKAKQAEELAGQTVELAVNMRATILGRHREELEGSRKIVYEAIQKKNFDMAKLGKITAETLVIVQNAERKAWGLDVEEKDTGKVKVIIERKDLGGVS